MTKSVVFGEISAAAGRAHRHGAGRHGGGGHGKMTNWQVARHGGGTPEKSKRLDIWKVKYERAFVFDAPRHGFPV